MLKRVFASAALLALVGVGLAGAQQDPPGTLKSYQEVDAFFKGKGTTARIKTGDGTYLITRKGGRVVLQALVSELSEDEARSVLLMQFTLPASVPKLHNKAELKAFVEGKGAETAFFCSFRDYPDSMWTRKGDKLIVASQRGGAVTVPKAQWEDAFLKEASTICMSNLKNIGTALEMYSTDFEGRYPTSSAPLAPDYLKEIPRCPANPDGYSFQMASNPDLYTVVCGGHHHGKYNAEGYPQYNSVTGLNKNP